MGNPTIDYERLHREFLANPKTSIRAICRKHEVKAFSSVAKYARENGWYDERDRIVARTAERTIEKVAERLSEAEADEVEMFHGEVLTVARAALYKFAEDLKDPSYRLRADELVKLINVGLLITGQPTSRTEERRLDLHGTFEGLPVDVLRGLAEATRPRQLEPGAAGGAARPGDEGALKN